MDGRPSSDQLFAAAAELVSTGSGPFKGTARRYSLCCADAEDAYQRSLEILLTKAPTVERSELKPWLHTVIKHEALALRRQRERLLAGVRDTLPEPDATATVPGPDEGAVERERARQTAEALGQLKSSEIQCLLLKALGYSYDEISTRTGFTWTKVNRSLTEGRKSFFDRFEQIESGERCRQFGPLLSAACDGEATREDQELVRGHLRTCHSCRALLRGYRAVPARLAQLLPPAVLLPVLQKGSWWSRLYEATAVGTGDRAGALGYKLQQVGELVSAQKAAAVVASTAALAGGTVAHRDSTREPDREKSAASGQEQTAPVSERATAALPTPASDHEQPAPGSNPPSGDDSERDAPAPAPAAEFAPEPVVSPDSAAAGSATQKGGLRFSGASQASGGQEFAP